MKGLHVDTPVTVGDIARAIRDIPNFPRPGVTFKDITPLLLEPRVFRRAVELMSDPFRGAGVTRVVSIESGGFLLGAPTGLALGGGLVAIRKRGKLRGARVRVEYAVEYGSDALEMHEEAGDGDDRVLIVDEAWATGG